jgi:putative sigma-54 modulation protein
LKIEFAGRHLEITPAIKEFTEKKLTKIEKYLNDNAEAQVTLSVEKHRQISEIVIKTRSLTLSGSEETDDMYVSIGLAVNKIEKQVKRLRQKLWGKKRKTRKRQQNSYDSWSVSTPGENANPNELRIIKIPHAALKPMTVEEAALQLSAANEQFIVFRNSENQKINVLYKRKDGNLGLIEPQYD